MLQYRCAFMQLTVCKFVLQLYDIYRLFVTVSLCFSQMNSLKYEKLEAYNIDENLIIAVKRPVHKNRFFHSGKYERGEAEADNISCAITYTVVHA